MGNTLPEISLLQFESQLRDFLPGELPKVALKSLHRHYEELRRWNRRLSLVGPGTASEIVGRHYGESLAALPLIRETDQKLVDLGSGAGFPGMVLSAALPRLEVTLVESRQRKWAFLRSAARRSGLSCICLNARVGRSLPKDFPVEVDIVTSRAVAITSEFLETLSRSSPKVRFLLWQGQVPLSLPPELRVSRELALEGSERRRILEISRKAL